MKAETPVVPCLLFLAQVMCKEAVELEDRGRILILCGRNAHGESSPSLGDCHRRHGCGGDARYIAYLQ